MLQTFVTEE